MQVKIQECPKNFETCNIAAVLAGNGRAQPFAAGSREALRRTECMYWSGTGKTSFLFHSNTCIQFAGWMSDSEFR